MSYFEQNWDDLLDDFGLNGLILRRMSQIRYVMALTLKKIKEDIFESEKLNFWYVIILGLLNLFIWGIGRFMSDFHGIFKRIKMGLVIFKEVICKVAPLKRLIEILFLNCVPEIDRVVNIIFKEMDTHIGLIAKR